jgi:hypothetical protein
MKRREAFSETCIVASCSSSLVGGGNPTLDWEGLDGHEHIIASPPTLTRGASLPTSAVGQFLMLSLCRFCSPPYVFTFTLMPSFMHLPYYRI